MSSMSTWPAYRLSNFVIIAALPRRAAPLARVHRVRLDLQCANRLRRRHSGGGIPALLDVVVGDDLVLLLAREAGVLGKGIAEARGQAVVGAAEALAKIEEPGQGEAAVGRRHHLLRRYVPAGDGFEDLERLVVLIGQEV